MFEANCSSAWFWSKLQHASFCLILMPEKSVMSVGREDSSVSETWRSVARLGKEGGPRRWSANSLLETAQRILICDFPVLHSMVCASINSTNPCTGSSIACHSVIHIWPQFINQLRFILTLHSLQFTSFQSRPLGLSAAMFLWCCMLAQCVRPAGTSAGCARLRCCRGGLRGCGPMKIGCLRRWLRQRFCVELFYARQGVCWCGRAYAKDFTKGHREGLTCTYSRDKNTQLTST
jgi:hypothetical protein